MPIRYAIALYGAVWLLLTLDARLHGRSAPPPSADACAATLGGGGARRHAAPAATPDCTTARR